jgi:alpha-tubulin suppressor-like RCC1 family protein
MKKNHSSRITFPVCALLVGASAPYAVACSGPDVDVGRFPQQTSPGDADAGGDPTTPVDTPKAPLPGYDEKAARIYANGESTCAVTTGGHVACWGDNSAGILGTGDYVDRPTPAWVAGLDGVVSLAMSRRTTCALKSDSSVWCWGDLEGGVAPATEVCGFDRRLCSTVPLEAPQLRGTASLDGGELEICAASTNGSLRCYGYNAIRIPPEVRGYFVTSVATGAAICFTFRREGGNPDGTACFSLYGNNKGQLGSGSTVLDGKVHVLTTAEPLVQLDTGSEHVCGVGASGTVSCWGGNDYADLGLGSPPTDAPFPGECLSVEAGETSFANCSALPAQIPALSAVSRIAATWSHTCAIAEAGRILCWGAPWQASNRGVSVCRLRDPGLEPECLWSPTPVAGIAGATSVAVGLGHGCAVSAGGAIQCWGLSAKGQLGAPGTGAPIETTPVTVRLPSR